MTTVNLHEKKGWWQSDLLKAANDDGTVIVMFKGDPRESQFQGKPKWCGIMYEDPASEQSEHTLNIEPEVEDQIKAFPKDVWLKCHVTGGKGKASIIIEDDAGPVCGGDAPVYAAPPNKGAYTPKPRVNFSEVVDEVTDLTMRAVDKLNQHGIEVGSADAQGIWSTLLIQMSK